MMAQKNILMTFEEVAQRFPHRIAVESGNQNITYQNLNSCADSVAATLMNHGVGPGQIAALYLEASLSYIVALLGVLKANAVFMPINTAAPSKLLAAILNKTEPDAFITDIQNEEGFLSKYSHLPLNFKTNNLFVFDSQMEFRRSAGIGSENSDKNLKYTDDHVDSCYIITTSGSTGEPKAILGSHKGLNHFISWETGEFDLNEDVKCSQLSPVTFDVSLRDIFVPLTTGGTLCIPDKETRHTPGKLFRWLQESKITLTHIVPTLFRMLLREISNTKNDKDVLPAMKHALIAGEMLYGHDVLNWRKAVGNHVELVNLYGPSETTLAKLFYRIKEDGFKPQDIIPIGKPIPDTEVLIIGDQKSCASGEMGEIYIKTPFMSKGYYNAPDLNEQAFVKNPLFQNKGETIYKTGDYGFLMPDGNIHFAGRIDGQIKLHGKRIETGEIEVVLRQHPEIEEAAVADRPDLLGNRRLVGYIVPKAEKIPTVESLRRFVGSHLPDYMVPNVFVPLKSLPLTHNGKIDRKALPEPAQVRPEMEQNYVPPSTAMEKTLGEIWAHALSIDRVGVNDNFFDLGGDSLLSVQVVEMLNSKFQLNLQVVKLFQYPTIRTLADYLSNSKGDSSLTHQVHNRGISRPTSFSRRGQSQIESNRMDLKKSENPDAVAIIGMAGRFPGASNIEAFWENLSSGRESITFFANKDLDPTVDPKLCERSNYVKARGILKDADKFDAAFFKINPREAEMMDPQQRIFLEVAWEALENAGYNPETYDGLIGVYAGMGENTYFANHVLSRRDLIETFGAHQTSLVNLPDYLATRVSYKFNLKGPSLNVFTGCSTSLVAVCQGFESLMSYQSDMVIAGGIFICCPQNQGYLYQEGGILSADGHCRAFDTKAQGTVFSNGAGVVALKRLADALEDGDHIYCVIRGSAMNNDGAQRVSFTAPNVDGQAQVIAMAQASASIEPETITYIETHGTGTPLGDPIELVALTKAFRASTEKKGFCAIGSVKANIGHLDAAAGIAGLIKTSLSLKYGMLPPSINFEKPNEKLEIESSPFYVNATLSKWKPEGIPRRAGVSSFGIGGTNAHVILEEPPEAELSGTSRPWQLLLLSAKTPTALDQMTINLGHHLKRYPNLNLADVAYTLQVGRKGFNCRRMAVFKNMPDAAADLAGLQSKEIITSSQLPVKRDVAFMFSGQGSQFVNMGLELYQTEKEFRTQVDLCSELLLPHLSFDLRNILYPAEETTDKAEEILKQTFVTQPALFVIEYALAKLWMKWGVNPTVMLGHSIGEYVAACLSGVFSLENALGLVAKRGRLIQTLPGGSMMAVLVSEKEIRQLINDDLSLAVINGPSLCVVSGETAAVKSMEKKLTAENINFRYLHTSHAFHSKMLDPVLDRFHEEAKKIPMNPPTIPFVSNVSGTWISSREATDPAYWVSHLRQTVRFSDCIETLTKEEHRVFLEIGPGQTLATLVRQHPEKVKEQVVLSSTPHPREQKSDVAFILNTVGRLWMSGADIDWPGFYGDENRRRVPLPAYPFERKRYWIDAEKSPHSETAPMADFIDQEEATTISDRLHPKSKKDDPNVPATGNDIEQIVAQIWEEVLGVDHADIHDNFFELGGSSIIALSLFARIEKTFGKKLPLATLYEAPTVEQMAEILRKEDRNEAWRSLVEINSSGNKPPVFFIHGAGGNILIYRDLAKYLGPDQPVYGLQSQGLDGKQPYHTRIEDMASHYIREIKSVQSEGPYLFCGYCMGGSVALEMAQQLYEEGHETALLALLETYNFSKIPPQSWFDNVYYYLQKIDFHWKNFLLLKRKEKVQFIQEKAKVARSRTKVWSGMARSKLSHMLHLENGNGTTLFNIWENNDLAALTYVPKTYAGTITQFLPQKEYAHHMGPELGWEKLAGGGLQTHIIPAYPAAMLVEPFVKLLADKLTDCINGASKNE